MRVIYELMLVNREVCEGWYRDDILACASVPILNGRSFLWCEEKHFN